MCTVCGCGGGETAIDGTALHHQDHQHPHDRHHDQHGHANEHHHHPVHDQSHGDGHGHRHHDHPTPAGAGRLIALEHDILAKNAAFAAANRRRLAEGGVLAVNLMSSPGSGKTTLLEVTVRALQNDYAVAVIEGDQQTAHDAERIRAAGVPAVQVNTGKGCHLDAHMVGHAIDRLNPAAGGILFIENVGNLVCPAGFDLGEGRRVVILSVTEGEDKPLKYPDIFAVADLVILTKSDLLPYLDFDLERCLGYARRVNPAVPVLTLSARTGEGVAAWLNWLTARVGNEP